MKNTILALFFLFSYQICIAQVTKNTFSQKEKQYLYSFKQIVSCLKNQTTFAITNHVEKSYSNKEVFYDSIITTFFSKKKMIQLFQKDTLVFAVAGKMDLVRHALNTFDQYLDLIPKDSIIIEAGRHLLEDSASVIKNANINYEEYKAIINSLNIFIILQNKRINLFTCYYDGVTNKPISLYLNDIREDDAKIIADFITRHRD